MAAPNRAFSTEGISATNRPSRANDINIGSLIFRLSDQILVSLALSVFETDLLLLSEISVGCCHSARLR
jgi:hypothetical protein